MVGWNNWELIIEDYLGIADKEYLNLNSAQMNFVFAEKRRRTGTSEMSRVEYEKILAELQDNPEVKEITKKLEEKRRAASQFLREQHPELLQKYKDRKESQDKYNKEYGSLNFQGQSAYARGATEEATELFRKAQDLELDVDMKTKEYDKLIEDIANQSNKSVSKDKTEKLKVDETTKNKAKEDSEKANAEKKRLKEARKAEKTREKEEKRLQKQEAKRRKEAEKGEKPVKRHRAQSASIDDLPRSTAAEKPLSPTSTISVQTPLNAEKPKEVAKTTETKDYREPVGYHEYKDAKGNVFGITRRQTGGCTSMQVKTPEGKSYIVTLEDIQKKSPDGFVAIERLHTEASMVEMGNSEKKDLTSMVEYIKENGKMLADTNSNNKSNSAQRQETGGKKTITAEDVKAYWTQERIDALHKFEETTKNKSKAQGSDGQQSAAKQKVNVDENAQFAINFVPANVQKFMKENGMLDKKAKFMSSRQLGEYLKTHEFDKAQADKLTSYLQDKPARKAEHTAYMKQIRGMER